MYVGVSPFPAVLLFGVTRIILVYLLFFFLFFVLFAHPFVFSNASSDHPPKLRQIPYITVPIRSLSRRFPTAERLPELRQFPICPVLGSLPNAYLGFWCPYTFWQRLSVCLTTGRNHRFLYPPFFYFLPYPYGDLANLSP